MNCFVFFVLGVALWTFYKSHPALLDVTMPKNDSILPLFIGNDLPVGVSGLVLAAVAAATMSTLSANLNAAASAITVDFYKRYWMKGSWDSRKLLVCGKVSTVVVGVLGGVMALGLANADIGNVYDQFQRFLGVLTGGLVLRGWSADKDFATQVFVSSGREVRWGFVKHKHILRNTI